MHMNNSNLAKHTIISSLVTTIVAMPVMFAFYFMLEPSVVSGETQVFTVTQDIQGEVSFAIPPVDVGMDTQIQGLSGGISNGSTTFSVNSNSLSGYTVTMQFDTGTGSVAMRHSDGVHFIPNLGGSPLTNFGAVEVSSLDGAAFGFTVEGTKVAQNFRELGGSCNQSTGEGNAENCWLLDDSVIEIVNNDTLGEEEYTLYFRVVVDNPTIDLPSGSYTATATLTLAENS